MAKEMPPFKLPFKTHKLRFTDNGPGAEPGRYRKSWEVTLATQTSDSTAEQMVTWTNSIMIDKMDIQFLMESDG